MENFEKIQKGIAWLKDEIDYSEEKIQNRKQELIDKHGDSFFVKSELELLDIVLEIKCDIRDFLPIFAISFFDHQIVENFKKCAKNEKMWSDTFTDGYLQGEDRLFFWNFLYEMGLSSNEYFMNYFDEFKKDVTEDGRFWNDVDQVCFLRLLIALEPQNPTTQKVLNYCLENNYHLINPTSSSIFILALTELNYSKFSETINEGLEYIRSEQNANGFWGGRKIDEFMTTFFSIKAICRVIGKNDEQLNKAIRFILDNQEPDGNWGNKLNTSFAIMSLLLVSPPFSISLEELTFNRILHEQEIKFHKPYFIHTSPIYDSKIHVNEIHQKILNGIKSANNTIRIISPYVDMLYEEIINLKNKNPSLDIKIITRPKKDIKGMRERIAKNVVDLLKISTAGNLKTLDVIHSRLIIIDDKELIISSADLTREGLFDEFNAGIITNDEETINKCIEYFENIWQIIQEKDV